MQAGLPQADIAIDAVGIEPTWQGAIAHVRTGGSVTVIGLGQAEGAVAVGDMVRRAITLRGHYAYTRADFDAALALLAEHPPPLHWLTTLPLGEGAEAFRRLVEEPAGTIKALLAVGPSARSRPSRTAWATACERVFACSFVVTSCMTALIVRSL